MQSYIYWALLGMVGYSFTTLFTKLAERSGDVSSFIVLAVSTIIVPTFVLSIVGSPIPEPTCRTLPPLPR